MIPDGTWIIYEHAIEEKTPAGVDPDVIRLTLAMSWLHLFAKPLPFWTKLGFLFRTFRWAWRGPR